MEIHTYRSVWDAIADSPEEAANLKLRSLLMDAIKAYIDPRETHSGRGSQTAWCDATACE